MYNGLYTGQFLNHASGLHSGVFSGLCGPDDSTSNYCSEARDLFVQMAVPPDPIRKRLINKTIKLLKITGYWYEADVLWVPSAHHSDAGLYNWKNPSLYKLIPISSPSFIADQGYSSNGTTSYLKTGWSPANNGVKYSLNSAFVCTYLRSNPVGSNAISVGCGDSAANQTAIFPRNVSGNQIARVNMNGGGNSSLAVADSLGLSSVKRTSSLNVINGKNGIDAAPTSFASTSLATAEMYLLAFNNAGSPINFFTGQLSYAAIGSGNIVTRTFYDIMQNYMTEIGSNV